MRYEPKGLKEDIQAQLTSEYGIHSEKLTFIPIGEESISFKIGIKNDTYIAKYNPDASTAPQTQKTHDLLLELADQDFIISPVKTLHQTTISLLENGYISVFPFIKGPLVVEENTDFHEELVEKLVEICSLLQNKTSTVQTPLPAEDFEDNYMIAFNEVLKQAQMHAEKPYAKISLQNERKIKELIEELSKLNAYYKKNTPPFVITHGDITGLNIIQVPGDIKLLDWDDCMLAPKERDLMFFIDSPFFNKEEYLQKVDESDIDEQLITYYKLRWALDSIVLNLQILATQDIAEADEKVKLMEVEEYLGYY